MRHSERPADLRARVLAKQPLLGMLVKLPAWSAIELLGDTGLDFVVIDAEHAPLGRAEVDGLILAARSVGLPALVRLPSASPDAARQALDCGAAGIVVPQVSSVEQARACAAMARYREGRGYSNTPRAGRFGALPMQHLVDGADASTVVLCQIESAQAVAEAAAIAAVPGVDGVLLGPADLAVSLGCVSPADGRVAESIAMVLERAGGRPKGLFLAAVADCRRYLDAGATLFVVGSDVSLLRGAAADTAAAFAGMIGKTP